MMLGSLRSRAFAVFSLATAINPETFVTDMINTFGTVFNHAETNLELLVEVVPSY